MSCASDLKMRFELLAYGETPRVGATKLSKPLACVARAWLCALLQRMVTAATYWRRVACTVHQGKSLPSWDLRLCPQSQLLGQSGLVGGYFDRQLP